MSPSSSFVLSFVLVLAKKAPLPPHSAEPGGEGHKRRGGQLTAAALHSGFERSVQVVAWPEVIREQYPLDRAFL